MSCEECPLSLVCLGRNYNKFRCSDCGAVSLYDPELGSGHFYVIKRCSELGLKPGTLYGACLICQPDVARTLYTRTYICTQHEGFMEWHRQLREPESLTYAEAMQQANAHNLGRLMAQAVTQAMGEWATKSLKTKT